MRLAHLLIDQILALGGHLVVHVLLRRHLQVDQIFLPLHVLAGRVLFDGDLLRPYLLLLLLEAETRGTDQEQTI